VKANAGVTAIYYNRKDLWKR